MPPVTPTVPVCSRLLLEPLCPHHAPGLFGPLCNPAVYEHIGEPPPATIAALEKRFAAMAAGPPPHYAEERWVNFAVRIRECGTLIGRVEGTIIDRRAEVAYLFGTEFQGHGYATDAMSAFQDYLRKVAGVSEFWATTTAGNARSIRLLKRLRYEQMMDSWPALLSYDDGDLVFVLR